YAHVRVVCGNQLVDNICHSLALGCDGGFPSGALPRLARVAKSQPGSIEERQVRRCPLVPSGTLELGHRGWLQPGCALSEVGGYLPQIGNEPGGLEHRPCLVEYAIELRVCRE